MFGIPTFDLLTDSGKQSFVEYVVNLMRNEIVSYTSSYINSATNITVDLTPYATIAMLTAHEADTTNVHGIVDTSDLLTTADLNGVVYQNTPYLDFDTVTPGTSGIGQLAWNDTNGTLEFILKGGNVALDIGQENVALVKHADNTGLTKGKVVYVAGSDGTNKTVRYAQANSEATSSKTFGVMAENATGGSKGFVCTQGIVSNLNTLALTEGAAVYVSPTTAGDLTSTKPSAPNHMVLVGFCVRSHASNGVLYISVVNGFELQELHNVSINVGTLANGDIIKYNASTQLWENVAADDIPAHASTHGSAGSDPITIAPSQVTGTAVVASDLSTHTSATTSVHGISNTANLVYTNDSRLTDTRTPTDASVTSPKFNIDYASAPTVTQAGALYYNTSSSKLFVWDGAAWDEVGGGTGVPIGTIIWTGQGTIPSGFLDCDGSSQLRSAYPDLFAAISTTYGQGSNPGTTFALPNVSSTTGNYAICAQVSPATITSESLIAVPIGTLQLYAGSVYPTGWLRADGSAISRTTYADLFSIIGTTYGSGDGSTTFNLPNLLSSGTGSPVYIIKVLLSGSIQPSTVAHAASHVRGGTDVIDADRAQIDYVPTNYTRNSGASEAGANTDLTAHLSGIDSKLGQYIISSTQPISPSIGWLWFDTTNGLLRIWNGSTWRPFVATTAATGASSYTGTPLQIAKHRWSNETVASSSTYIDATGSSYTFKPLYAASRLEVVAELAMAPYYPGSSYAGMACRVLRDGNVLTYQNQTHQVYLSSGVDLYSRTVMSWQGAANNINSTIFKIQVAGYAATNNARLNQAGNWESFITITEWAI